METYFSDNIFQKECSILVSKGFTISHLGEDTLKYCFGNICGTSGIIFTLNDIKYIKMESENISIFSDDLLNQVIERKKELVSIKIEELLKKVIIPFNYNNFEEILVLLRIGCVVMGSKIYISGLKIYINGMNFHIVGETQKGYTLDNLRGLLEKIISRKGV